MLLDEHYTAIAISFANCNLIIFHLTFRALLSLNLLQSWGLNHKEKKQYLNDSWKQKCINGRHRGLGGTADNSRFFWWDDQTWGAGTVLDDLTSITTHFV